jgi:predicted Zn-dependent protease
MISGVLSAAAALLAVAGAAPARAPALVVPPFQGVYEPQGVDERGLWMEADEHERRVRDSNLLIRDAALNDYVKGVLCRTVGEDRCRNVRTYVLRVPIPNASMGPNGTLIVWSGLLLRCRSEAELASVLGHEFAHFERRHSLNRFRRARSTGDAVTWIAVLGAIAAVPTNLDILMFGAYFSFSRDQEREADILGLAYLSRSRYRPLAAAEMWGRMMDEADASALGRAQRSRRYDRTAFFASHPTDLERTTYLRTLAGADTSGRNDGADGYGTVMRPWIRTFLDDQVKLNDFGGTEYLLAQLAQGGWTADLLYARGELYRMRGNPRDLVNAADFYRQSIAMDETRPEAFRGLGLALMRAQSVDEGKRALTRYLALKPDATDAPMIRMLVGQGI